MKKALVILLALLMLVSVAACGGKTEDTSKPADSSKPADTSKPADSGKTEGGDAAEEGAKLPADLGHYDPDFDYTQYPKKKAAYLGMTAGELWDAYDVSYENYCNNTFFNFFNIFYF